jgi:twinkle protein
MKESYYRYGTTVYIVDDIMCVSFDENGAGNMTHSQTDFLTQLIRFIKDNNLICHIIAHPKKPMNGCYTPLDEYSIAGTSNIANLMDKIFAFEKPYKSDFKEKLYDRQLTLLKDRTIGNTAQIGLYYDRATRRLYEKEEDKMKKYKWDDGTLRYSEETLQKIKYFGGNLVGSRQLACDIRETDCDQC